MPITYDYEIMRVVVSEISEAMKNVHNGEDVKFRFAHILRKRVLDYIGIPYEEYGVHIGFGIIDSIYSKVIFNYDEPHSFDIRSKYDRSLSLLKRYIIGLAKNSYSYKNYHGIAFDGFKIGLVHFDYENSEWLMSEPIILDEYILATIIQKIIEG